MTTVGTINSELRVIADSKKPALAALQRAIAEKLTDKQRAAILGELRELPFDEVAHLLGTNRNAAYKLVHDARCALKRHLIEEGISGADVRAAFAI